MKASACLQSSPKSAKRCLPRHLPGCLPRHRSCPPRALPPARRAPRAVALAAAVSSLQLRGAYRSAPLSALARGGSRATCARRLGRATARCRSRRARALPDAARCVSQCGAQRVARASDGGARARACGWQAAPLPVVALTPPWTFCQARADLLTAHGVRGGVVFKASRAPTLSVRLTLAVYAFAACANLTCHCAGFAPLFAAAAASG